MIKHVTAPELVAWNEVCRSLGQKDLYNLHAMAARGKMAGLPPMWRHLNCKQAPEKSVPSGLGKGLQGGFLLCAKAMSIDILRFSSHGRCIATGNHLDSLFCMSQFRVEPYLTLSPSAHLERPLLIGYNWH